MKKTIGTVFSFIIVFALLVGGYYTKSSKWNEFKTLQTQVSGFANSTNERLEKAIVTLPEGNLVVGLNKYIGTYKYDPTSVDGEIKIENEHAKTKFLEGSYNERVPRLDVVVPMYVSEDKDEGSKYIVLFHDRGDTVIEKSYARLGAKTTMIESLSILPSDPNIKEEEYRVKILYKIDNKNSIIKEVIISVVDGHFNPKEVIDK